MKNQKGITISSLIIYIIVLLIVIITLATIRNNFQSGLKEVSDNSATEAEFNRFNLYFLEDTRRPGNTTKINEHGDRIEFSSGHIYEFNSEKETVYWKEGEKVVPLLEAINDCVFSSTTIKGKTIITVTVEFLSNIGKESIKNYTLLEETNTDLYEDEEDYVNKIEEATNENSEEIVNEL